MHIHICQDLHGYQDACALLRWINHKEYQVYLEYMGYQTTRPAANSDRDKSACMLRQLGPYERLLGPSIIIVVLLIFLIYTKTFGIVYILIGYLLIMLLWVIFICTIARNDGYFAHLHISKMATPGRLQFSYDLYHS